MGGFVMIRDEAPLDPQSYSVKESVWCSLRGRSGHVRPSLGPLQWSNGQAEYSRTNQGAVEVFGF